MAEMMAKPRGPVWEVEAWKQRAWDVASQAMASPRQQLEENVHAAAFYDSVGLGRSPYATHALSRLTVQDVDEYYQQYMTTEKAVVVGLGVEETTLDTFSSLVTFHGDGAEPKASSAPVTTYVGGEERTRVVGMDATHVAVAFEGVGIKDAQWATALVLKQVLAANVKTIKGEAFNHVYQANGLIGVRATSTPLEARACVESLVGAVKAAAAGVDNMDAVKAEATLAFALEMDQSHTQFLALGQMGLADAVKTTEEVAQAIGAVSASDVQALATQMLDKPPTLASVGDLSTVPRYNEFLGLV